MSKNSKKQIRQLRFNDFINQYNIALLPLTVKMCEKNDFSRCQVLFTEDYDGITGICIFDTVNHYIRINVLEVRSDCKNSGIGRALIEKIKSFNRPIGLHSLEESIAFYEKMGFYVSEEGCFELEYTE